jgi:uncharacterized LabA/DUF88 family protein
MEMIRAVIQDKCDATVLISADSDLLPPINLIRELNPQHKIYVFFPPNRYSADLAQNADGHIKLSRYESRFKSALLEDEIILPNKYKIIRPAEWV